MISLVRAGPVLIHWYQIHKPLLDIHHSQVYTLTIVDMEQCILNVNGSLIVLQHIAQFNSYLDSCCCRSDSDRCIIDITTN